MSDFSLFFKECIQSPKHIAALLPALMLMLVNGWTDAPVNIATAIRSKAIRPNSAILMSAVFNFLGAVVMCFFGSSVAVSIYSISGLADAGDNAMPALCASVTAVVLWSLTALKFGLPTSESHALTAGLSGAAVAVSGIGAVNGLEWLKLLVGIILSTIPVAILGYFAAVFLKRFAELGDKTFKRLQLLGAMLSSFAHGAQDGQKFAGLLTLTAVLTAKRGQGQVTVPVWTAMVSATVIALGTLIGGKRILRRFGELAPSDPAAGFASDLVSSVALTLLSVSGLPASTTHAKSSAVIGAGFLDRRISQNTETLKAMVLAWVLTFPVSAALGFGLAKIFLLVF